MTENGEPFDLGLGQRGRRHRRQQHQEKPRRRRFCAHALLLLATVVALSLARPSAAHAETGTGLRLTYEALGGLGGFVGSVGTALLLGPTLSTSSGRAITGGAA